MIESKLEDSVKTAFPSSTPRPIDSEAKLSPDSSNPQSRIHSLEAMESPMLSGTAPDTDTPNMNLYSSRIITVKVGPNQDRTYFVHSAVLSQCRGMTSHIDSGVIVVPDVIPAVFELALSFLYSRTYLCSSPERPLVEKEQLKMHSFLYCFATYYNIEGLIGLAMRNIRELRQLTFLDILDTAQQVYPKLLDNDPLYRDFFVEETKKAMMEDITLAQEPRILDLFGKETGHLTRDLFVALSGCVRSDTTLTPGTSVSGSAPCEDQASVVTQAAFESQPNPRILDSYIASGHNRALAVVIERVPSASNRVDETEDAVPTPLDFDEARENRGSPLVEDPPVISRLAEELERESSPSIDLASEHTWSDGDSSSEDEYEYESESDGDSEFWSDTEDVDEHPLDKMPFISGKKETADGEYESNNTPNKDKLATFIEQQLSPLAVGTKRKDLS